MECFVNSCVCEPLAPHTCTFRGARAHVLSAVFVLSAAASFSMTFLVPSAWPHRDLLNGRQGCPRHSKTFGHNINTINRYQQIQQIQQIQQPTFLQQQHFSSFLIISRFFPQTLLRPAMARGRSSESVVRMFLLLVFVVFFCRGLTWNGPGWHRMHRQGPAVSRRAEQREQREQRSSYESSPGWTKSVVNGHSEIFLDVQKPSPFRSFRSYYHNDTI